MDIKETAKTFILLAKRYHLVSIASCVAASLLGVANFALFLIYWDWLHLSSASFYALFVIGNMIFRFTKMGKKANPLVFGATMVGICLIPMAFSLRLKMEVDGTSNLIFDWMLYAYALYAFIRFGHSIYSLCKRKSHDERDVVGAYIRMFSAIYTMVLLTDSLLCFTESKGSDSMRTLYIVIQAVAIVLGILLVIYFLSLLYLKRKKASIDKLKTD